MYRVFKREEESLKHIINIMNPYITARGKAIITDPKLLEEPLEFTKKLLDLKAEIDNLIEVPFNNDMKF
jgi:hypothetical protein